MIETLEFIIYPDGRVVETVTGVSGTSCMEVTAAIEEQLGCVVSQQPTSEYYASQEVEEGQFILQSMPSQW